MINNTTWVALFSQTGTEIYEIAKCIGHVPDVIITNAPEEKINPAIYSLETEIRRVPWKPTVDQYFSVFPKDLNIIITLHGWLKIIPSEICEAFKGKILNGHPALLTEYPELKGKDKQEDVANNPEKFPLIGSVIHEVIPQLDEGRILYSCSRENISTDISSAYNLLRGTSLATWMRFFEDYKKSPELLEKKNCFPVCFSLSK